MWLVLVFGNMLLVEIDISALVETSLSIEQTERNTN